MKTLKINTHIIRVYFTIRLAQGNKILYCR
jgi:hypothetical protein